MTQPKLNKDQIQKLVLSGLGFIALVYVYFTFFLGPLNRSRATTEKTMEDLQAKLGSSKSEMARAATLEREASSATARYATLQSFSPEGAPIAWFPPKMKAFFANQQIDKATAKPEGSGIPSPYKQVELVDWAKYSWQIDLPQTEFVAVGQAIAQLENTEPLLDISRLSIKGGAENAQFQQVTLSVNTAIVKR